MCKYCKYIVKPDGDFHDEQCILTKDFLKTCDGGADVFGYVFGLDTTIYRDKEQVYLSSSVVTCDGGYTVVSKKIKIKYCPFCGEELT